MRAIVCLAVLVCLAAPVVQPRAATAEVAFATFLGGSDFDDGRDVAVDAAGNVYVVGSTSSPDFPVVGALQGALAEPTTSDAFVVKIAPDGRTVVFATYLGGTATDSATAVAVDETGAVYVAGTTQSKDFPLRNAMQAETGGGSDAFVAKLAPDGHSLVFSTFFGGTGDEAASDLQLRADLSVAVGGRTTSADLPLASPQQGTFGGGPADGFVAVVGAAGANLENATYVGGSGDDQVDAVVVGPTGVVYASGVTGSADFAPCPAGLDQGPHSFLAVAAGAAPRAPYAFPCAPGSSIAAAAAAGGPQGAGFQLRALAGGGADSLDTRAVTVSADLAYVREQAIGGAGQDYPDAIAIGADGATAVAGDTDSEDFPLVSATQPAFGGFLDAFIAVLAPGTDQPLFATYLGGSDVEFPAGVAVDAAGNVYVTGVTFSADFPTSEAALQDELGGPTDAFVVKYSAPEPAGPDFAISAAPPVVVAPRNSRGSITVNVNRGGGFTGNVTVRAPNAKPIKAKVSPATLSTTGAAVTFTYKVKKKAVPGTYPLVFTATDSAGRSRTATLTLVVQ
jgi:hypothetical protein